jgi:hypothetical protein
MADAPVLSDELRRIIHGQVDKETKRAALQQSLQKCASVRCGGACLAMRTPPQIPSAAPFTCAPTPLLCSWWGDYSHRKNEEEDMVADSLLYDERCHLPRTTAGAAASPCFLGVSRHRHAFAWVAAAECMARPEFGLLYTCHAILCCRRSSPRARARGDSSTATANTSACRQWTQPKQQQLAAAMTCPHQKLYKGEQLSVVCN